MRAQVHETHAGDDLMRSPLQPRQHPARVGEGMGDLWQQVETIRCPVLIVRGGESDILAPEVAARFGGIVGAEVRTVHGAGHSVMGDNPAGFLAAVEPFLAGLPPV